MTAARPLRSVRAVSEAIAEGAAGLNPIALDELNAQAAFQTRIDRKYVIDPATATAVFDFLLARRPQARALEIEGRRMARYRSMYFDTPAFDSYLQAAHRRRRRFKVRTRQYVDTRRAFVEIKRSGPRGATVKEREPHPFGHLMSIDDTAHARIEDAMTFTGLPPGSSGLLRPSLQTSYRRATILVPHEDPSKAPWRVTVDSDLGWDLPTGSARIRWHDRAVVETKSGGAPGPVDRLLWSLGVRPAKMSKYGTGLAALDPELPSAPFNRSLRRHFGIDGRLAPAA